MRVMLILMLLACSKSSNPIEQAPANEFPARQHVPTDHDLVEEWTRDITDPYERGVRGVDATKLRSGNGEWQVTVWAMEFIRDVALETKLRMRIPAALRAVPGVVEVREDDREVWSVRGTPTGSALVDAVARVVDQLAPEARAEITRQR